MILQRSPAINKPAEVAGGRFVCHLFGGMGHGDVLFATFLFATGVIACGKQEEDGE